MDVILKCELGIWGVLFMGVAGGAWLAGSQANRLSERVGSTIAGTLGRLAVQKGAQSASSVATGVGGALMRTVPIAGAVTYVGTKVANYFSGMKGAKS